MSDLQELARRASYVVAIEQAQEREFDDAEAAAMMALDSTLLRAHLDACTASDTVGGSGDVDHARVQVDMTDSEKATRMGRFSLLAGVRRFLSELGPWPKTDAEWAAAYDLYMEQVASRRRRPRPA